MQHGERRERIRGEAAAAAACVLWAGPCVRSAAVRHGLGCGGRGRRGAPDSAYSEAPGRHVSGAASLQSPRGLARSGSRLARSLHLLPLAVLQPVRNDAVSGPLPPFAPGPGSEQGAGRRMESARGEGRNRRKHPEAPPAGRAGPPPLPPPAARAGERGPEAKAKAAGRARGEPPACSARCGREFLARLCPAGAKPPRVAGTPLLCRCDVSASSGTCSKTFGAFPKEKQTVTNALGARASFSPPGLAASGTQTSAGFQCLPDAPPGARFHHHPLRLPSLPLSSLAWFTSLCHRIALLPLQRVFAKDCLPSHRGPVPSLPQDRHLFRKRDL